MDNHMKNGLVWKLRERFLRGKPAQFSSPVPLVLLLLSYLMFIKKLGPHWMKNRPAYDLRSILIIYNVTQVIYSLYVFSLGLSILRVHGFFDHNCNALSESYHDSTLYAVFCYLIAKITELLDTVFFVLRKKQNQVTLLHVYHHSMMVAASWLSMLYETSFSVAFLGTLNCFVHAVMYGYYCLSTIPALRRYLWWKKYLTSLQIIQFGLVFIHVVVFNATTKCYQSYLLFVFIIVNVIIFMYLFSKFYVDSYMKEKTNVSIATEEATNIKTRVTNNGKIDKEH